MELTIVIRCDSTQWYAGEVRKTLLALARVCPPPSNETTFIMDEQGRQIGNATWSDLPKKEN